MEGGPRSFLYFFVEEPHLPSISEVGVRDDDPRVLEIFGQVKCATRLERGRFRSGELVSTSGQRNIGLPCKIETSISLICCTRGRNLPFE